MKFFFRARNNRLYSILRYILLLPQATIDSLTRKALRKRPDRDRVFLILTWRVCFLCFANHCHDLLCLRDLGLVGFPPLISLDLYA